MSDRSPIEWTDATWNPVRGCTKVSPGCKFCYAELLAERVRGVPGHPFEQGFDMRLVARETLTNRPHTDDSLCDPTGGDCLQDPRCLGYRANFGLNRRPRW